MSFAGGRPVPRPDEGAVEHATAGRDRYLDALRAGSLFVVVLGHWLIVTVSAGGRVGNVLTELRGFQPVTWLLQVMPVFFLVGGVIHARSLERIESRAGAAGTRTGRYAFFVRSRAARLLRPTGVFLAVWVGVGLMGHAIGAAAPAGEPPTLLQMALGLLTQLLWFVGIYLGVAALAPVMYRLHQRWGWLVVIVLWAAAVAVDGVRFGVGWDRVGTLNFAFVWLALHQLGFCWRSGLVKRGTAALLAGVGATTMVLLVTVGPYPVSMIGLPGQSVSNMAPPTVALLAQGTALAGVAILGRDRGEQLLSNDRVWRAVMTAAGVAMTLFLWHLSALALVFLAVVTLSIPTPTAGSAMWWLTRPLWLGALAAVAAVLVLLFRRFDSPRPASPAPVSERRRWPDVLAAVGVALAVGGVLAVSLTGVDVIAGPAVPFLGMQVRPFEALLALTLGSLVLVLARPRRQR